MCKLREVGSSLLIYVYYVLLVIFHILLSPLLALLSLLPKYKKSIPARFFLVNNPEFINETYWFHSCSLGETKALFSLIKNFSKVNISVVTNTGFEEAKKYNNADVRFLPFETLLPFWVKQCKAFVVMEAELWLMLFFIAKKRCHKTILINARISDKSYPKYKRFRFFYRLLFKYVDTVFAQSPKDRQRLIYLGARNVIVSGNIKTLGSFDVTRHYQIKTDKKIIVAGSTHKSEERTILNSVDFNRFSLVIVPRHPERFDDVWNIIEEFSKKNNLSSKRIDDIIDADIVLADKMGELINLYAIADIVVLGGAFGEYGGHNPIEAAYFNKPLISGKHIFNQEALFEQIENYYLTDPSDLKNTLEQDLKNSVIKNRGSIEQILKEIKN